MIPTCHINDPRLKYCLYFGSERYIGVSFSPLIISFQCLISFLRLVILIGPEQYDLLIGMVHVTFDFFEVLLELSNKFKLLGSMLDPSVKEDPLVLHYLILREVEIRAAGAIQDGLRLHDQVSH